MSVQGFTDIVHGPLGQYLQISLQIGGDVAQHSQLVQQAFGVQLQFLQLANQSAKPANQNDLMNLLKPTSDCITAIQNFREAHRTSTFFNHLSAISESIPALGWVAVVSIIIYKIFTVTIILQQFEKQGATVYDFQMLLMYAVIV